MMRFVVQPYLLYCFPFFSQIDAIVRDREGIIV